jgi:hypothetical protein
MDEARSENDVLRALVMTLLAAYYRARPSDTRLEQAALAALPAGRRATSSVQLGRMIELARELAQQEETRRRHERKTRPMQGTSVDANTMRA